MSVVRVSETGSTNADLLALVGKGDGAEGDWLVADRQTSGRGRMGRAWESPPGNLYASTIVVLRPDDPPAPTLGFVTALGVYETFVAFADPARLRLKWPNDVLALTATGIWAKLSGILLERADRRVVIGIGANLVDHPLRLDRPVTSLLALGGGVPDRDAFLDVLIARLAHWVAVWRGAGLEPVSAAWLAHAHPAGTPLAVSLADGEWIDATFDGLGPDCSLQLRLADGARRAIHAGDVFLI